VKVAGLSGAAPRALLAVVAAAAGLLILPSVHLYAQEGYTLIRSLVIPPTFYVGDRVELRLRIQPDKGRNAAAPLQLPRDPYLHFESVTVRKLDTEAEVRIIFESYAPGERELPPIRLGEVVLTGIKVRTASLVSSGHATLSEPKGQLFLPGSGLVLALLIAVLFGAPPLIFFSIRGARRLVSLLVDRREFERPWVRLRAALARLDRGEGYDDARGFYILVCDELRLYMSKRVVPDYLTATAREFAPLTERALPDLPQAKATIEVMRFADQVKFAGAEAGPETLTRDAGRVREAAEAIEARVRSEREAGRKGGVVHAQL